MKNNINTQMLYKPAHDTHNSHKETHKKNSLLFSLLTIRRTHSARQSSAHEKLNFTPSPGISRSNNKTHKRLQNGDNSLRNSEGLKTQVDPKPNTFPFDVD